MIFTLFGEKSFFIDKAYSRFKKEVVKKESKSPAKEKVKPPTSFLNLDIVKKIHKRQARRTNALDSLKEKGSIGESDLGLLKIRQTKGLTKKDIVTMKKLVQVENNDRLVVYKKIQELEKYNKIEMKVLVNQMFEKYLELDLPGTYYFQNSTWKKKK